MNMREAAFEWVSQVAEVVKELVAERKQTDPQFKITEASVVIGDYPSFLSKMMAGENKFSLKDLAVVADYFGVSEEIIISRAKKTSSVNVVRI